MNKYIKRLTVLLYSYITNEIYTNYSAQSK